ncbi:FAD-dependent oxidoreductase [Allorhizobium borbori]|uniref:Succinate dehydrogenase/fumarate reductase flavoprotein subunit n=1 Tax=Allorhizobium borbori TaxID=485907 RepID=A0A7W6P3W4_9HYPH|nr:FAD-dependent oxidoreductase [Allorhizobium borbori]MBB4105306.1 succinate dehydrogenase/fumarate reductase flavoprotein subunit [Allorhizobium borbori]
MPGERKAETMEEVDLLVCGAGAGGMTAALVAALEGLNVVLAEKTAQVGGTTSTSGGTTWVPGTHLSEQAGVPDKVEDARAFLESVVANRGGARLREAFLASGRAAIEELDRKTDVKFVAAAAHPDYLDGPGAAYGGRALGPVMFDGKLLGREDFDRVRPPRREFMGLGGMMVGRNELGALLSPFASLANLRSTLGIVGGYVLDRVSYKRGTRLLMGNALVARLLYSLRKAKVPVLFESGVRELMIEDGRVVGAVLEGPTGTRRIRARKGVVLATGGICWNRKIRERLFPAGTRDYALGPQTNTGDGADVAMAVGARFDDGGDSPALWMPCSSYTRPDGSLAVWPHIILDRAKPGLFAVDAKGKRFVNEANSYHDFAMGQIATGAIPAHLVCDAAFMRRYGMGMILPGAGNLAAMLKAGYVIEAKTLAELAGRLGCDAKVLAETVEAYNRSASTGVDEAFGRGSSVVNRFNGDAEAGGSNPCLGPVGAGPYYAMAVRPADLASSAGLAGDEFGRVLNEEGEPIAGLYACGNDLASIFRGTYPGPGTTIGPAMVFGWRVAKHAAGKLTDQPETVSGVMTDERTKNATL